MGQIYIKSEHGHCDFLDVGSRRILRDPNFLLKKSVRDLNIFFLNFLILGIVESMNFCPPKPGFTLINKTKSNSGRIEFIVLKGVAGFRTMPAFKL